MPTERVSERERVAHVVRRLTMGAGPELVEAVPDAGAAVAAALDLTAPAPVPPELPAPRDAEDATRVERLREPATWWLRQMVASRRPVEERLVWFWHDHFATAIGKVRSPDLMWRQHLTIRAHATGSFADLLRAVTRDPAMLVYLDGVRNTAAALNENHGRELLELHTLGVGHYTQADVVAAARACTGWVVNAPFRRRLHRADLPDGAAFEVPARHDDGPKTFLGATGRWHLDDVVDVLLSRPRTARFVAAKLHRALVGTPPDASTLAALADRFERDWSILALTEQIAASPAFTADAAVRTRVRTPLERVVGLLQAAREPATGPVGAAEPLARALAAVSYVPFAPPSPAGYRRGAALLGPHDLVHGFDALAALQPEALPDLDGRATLARFGLHDVAPGTVALLDRADDPLGRFALALGSPEYALA